MKSILTMAICLVTLFSFSQTIQPLNVQIVNDLSSNDNASVEKSATCGIDTVEYTLNKATGLSALSINNATSALAMSQYFNAPQAITVSGLDFFAYKIDATGGITIDVTVEMFLAGADSLPTGLPLATSTVAVDTAFGGGTLSILRKTTTFTPVTVTQPYVMVVTNNSPNSVGYIFSDYNVADGAGEWLTGVNLFGTWTHSYDVNVGGAPFDADMLSYPHVSYSLASSFSVLDDCLLTGTTSFTNSSSPVISDRMYNIAVFVGSEELSYSWDYGYGSPIENAIDPTHIFPSIGYNTNITLTDTLYGWTSNCVADTMIAIGDSIESIWSSSQSSLDAAFTDLSYSRSSITTYLWDFGDGNTSTIQNPNHTYAMAGTYTVCLTVNNSCNGVSTTCNSVTVTSCSNPIANFTISGIDPDFVFTNTSTTVGTTTYAWDMGDLATYTTSDATHSYASNGVFTVTLMVTDSCGTHTATQDVTVTSVCVDPVASFTVSGTEPNFVFTNTSATTGMVSYAWDMGDLTTYTTEDVSHLYTSNDTYTVTLIVTDSCGTHTISEDVVVSVVGINDIELNSLRIFPVPASQELTIESTFDISNLQIRDVTGRIVFTSELNGSNTTLSIADFANGEYFVHIDLVNGEQTIKRFSIVH